MHLWDFNRELEDNLLVGQGLVNSGKGVQLGLNVDQVLRIKVDLQDLGAINLVSDALANDLGRVNNVLQNGIVHSSEGS